MTSNIPPANMEDPFANDEYAEVNPFEMLDDEVADAIKFATELPDGTHLVQLVDVNTKMTTKGTLVIALTFRAITGGYTGDTQEVMYFCKDKAGSQRFVSSTLPAIGFSIRDRGVKFSEWLLRHDGKHRGEPMGIGNVLSITMSTSVTDRGSFRNANGITWLQPGDTNYPANATFWVDVPARFTPPVINSKGAAPAPVAPPVAPALEPANVPAPLMDVPVDVVPGIDNVFEDQ